jgi:hypothetical protein
MNNRRKYREIVKISRESSAPKSLLTNFFGALRLFILFFLISNTASAQNIQNQQYDINDPRNPNCPCHKLQKLADDEYQRILNDNNGNEQRPFAMNTTNLNKPENNNHQQLLNVNNFNQIINNENESNPVNSYFYFKSKFSSMGSGGSGSSVKKKKPTIGFYKKLNRAKLKHSKIKKVRPNYSVCYKW